MQTVNAQTSTPTHVAFFDFAPQDRVEFRFEVGRADAYNEAIVDLMTKYPGRGIPTIREIALRPATPAVAESVARDGAQSSVSEEVLPSYSSIQAANGAKPVSTWGATVLDPEAKARVDAQQAKLVAAGVAGLGHELFTTGTRMADVGYATQAQRAAEHEGKMPLRDAAEQLAERVRAEKRTDLVVTARELASQVTINGALKLGGFKLQEQAIRGLLSRADSPSVAYVFGLRDRIADRVAMMRHVATGAPSAESVAEIERLRALISSDKAELAQVLAHELRQAGDVEVKLRVRESLGDAFAAVSPKYAPADAPEVLARVLKGLPGDARGSWSYDPATTSWELRAEVWTPTPVTEQAVGEPFRGYVSFRSRDNGTGSLCGGGGIEILACLNASTYVASASGARRRHVGEVEADVERMVAEARRSIDVLCEAWGVAREVDLSPAYEAMVGLTLSQAVPGFWWGEFGDRKSELHHVLRGSSKRHVAGLTDMTLDQRAGRGRASEPLTKADLAQGWTKYVQRLPGAERRDAEAAAASWVVSQRPVRFDADRVEVEA